MKIIKTKVVVALIASVGFFLFSAHNSYKHSIVACETPFPYVDLIPLDNIQTECRGPRMIECCILHGDVYYKGVGAI